MTLNNLFHKNNIEEDQQVSWIKFSKSDSHLIDIIIFFFFFFGTCSCSTGILHSPKVVLSAVEVVHVGIVLVLYTTARMSFFPRLSNNSFLLVNTLTITLNVGNFKTKTLEQLQIITK